MRYISCNCLRVCSIVGLLIAILIMTSSRGEAYTPKSKKVRDMVKLGVRFLESVEDETRLGGQCLMALAAFKAQVDDDPQKAMKHKLVQRAIKSCRAATKQFDDKEEKDVYNIAIAIIFLCDLDSQGFRSEIKYLQDQLMRRQRKDGSWSYPGRSIGDTSVTQYGVLALWTLKNRGFDVDLAAAERCCAWLLRTQDKSGAWSYLGEDPGDYTRLDQSKHVTVTAGRITPSMIVAGLGSVYMAADVLELTDRGASQRAKQGLPAGFELIDTGAAKFKSSIPKTILSGSIRDGESSYRTKCRTTTTHWQHYYLYGVERYESFRELALNIKNEEPKWYNDGVDFLARVQKQDGQWMDTKGMPGINTSFGLLFLLRSTKKSIQEALGDGLLIGGKTLPKDVSNLSLGSDGRVKKTQMETDVDALMEAIKKGESMENVDVDVAFAQQATALQKKMAELRGLVSAESPEARKFAVRAIAKSGNLDNVPALIYALSDPNPLVMREARDGLRFVSRRFRGFGLADTAVPKSVQVTAAQDKWKAWYKSIRPDADVEFFQDSEDE